MVKEPDCTVEGYPPRRSPGRPKSPARKVPATKSPTQSKGSESAKRGSQSRTTRGSPARTKSPARNRSPGRPRIDRGAQKSPKSKSPSRKGASEAKTSSQKVTIELEGIDLDLSGSEEETVPKEKPKATVRGRSRKLDEDKIVQTSIKAKPEPNSINTYVGDIRRITRNSQAQDERVVHLRHFDVVTKKLGEFSDDDEISLLSSTTIDKKRKTSLSECFGILFQIIFAPIFVIGLYLFCNKSHCSFVASPNWTHFKSFSVFFDLRSFLGYSVLVIFLAIHGALPLFGKKVPNLPGKQGKFIYVTNGFSSLIIVALTCVALEYFQFHLSKFIVDHILHLLVSATLFGVAFSVYLFLRSFYVPVSSLNPTEIDKPVLNGFFYGREVNPRLLGILDLKMYILRICCISLILGEVAFLIKGSHLDTKLIQAITNYDFKPLASHPTLLVLVTLHTIYSMDVLFFESRSLSSYFIQYEGLGYRTAVGILLSPFLLIVQTKYVVDYRVHLPNWELGLLCMVYCIGYLLYRLSNNQKDAFRRNPYSPVSLSLESISTSQGKKLLCSGYWGSVRQPNILGDIIMHATLIPFSFNVPTLIGVIAILLMLIERALRAQVICKSKYGAAWDKYCHKVKYVLVPKIY